jgi:hypothetical protein
VGIIRINLRTLVSYKRFDGINAAERGYSLADPMSQQTVPPPNSPIWVMIGSIIVVLCAFGFIVSLSGLI